MGLTKSFNFSDEQNELALKLKALGHPARIAILQYLLSVDTCVCGDIVNEIPLAQPTVSQHLKELKNAGIIKGAVEGTSICYCIDAKGFESVELFFNQVIAHTKNNEFKCC